MNKITKNDLLKLKDSKAVPITAHSHEVIVPVVFASKVNKFLEREGIKLPLTHHQLSEYKKKAAKTPGHYVEDVKECDEGNSHAKGTHNVKVSNIKGSVYINTQPIKAKRRKGKGKGKGKGRIFTTFKGLIEPPNTSILKNRIQPPPSNTLRPNYNTFAMIRPQGITYSANTPTLQDIQKELQIESNKEKDALNKQVEKLKKEGEERSKQKDDLERALERERANEDRLIHFDTRLNKPGLEAAAASSSSSSSGLLQQLPPKTEPIAAAASSSSLQEQRPKSPDLSLHQQLMEEDPEGFYKELKKQAIDDLKVLKRQSGKTIDYYKKEIILLMEDYARQLGYVMTQRDYKRIKDQNNYQSIGQEYMGWVGELFD